MRVCARARARACLLACFVPASALLYAPCGMQRGLRALRANAAPECAVCRQKRKSCNARGGFLSVRGRAAASGCNRLIRVPGLSLKSAAIHDMRSAITLVRYARARVLIKFF